MGKRDAPVNQMAMADWGKCEAALGGLLVAVIAGFHKALGEHIKGEDAATVIPQLTAAYTGFLLARARAVEFRAVPTTPTTITEPSEAN